MNSRYQQERHHPPYYLLTGLILGLALGFGITFLFFPVHYTNVPPETLQSVDKDQYRLMIASAFQANNDLGRAQARLGVLREDNLAEILLQQAQRSQLRSDAQLLLKLSQALQKTTTSENTTGVMASATPGIIQATQTKSADPSAEATSLPVRSATPLSSKQPSIRTPLAESSQVSSLYIPFRLVEEKSICDPTYKDSLIQVEVVDKKEKPISNARVFVTWDGGQDVFYTGYFPEISSGYADFSMTPAINYSVRIGEIGEVIENISAPECSDDNGNQYWGSISLLFAEP